MNTIQRVSDSDFETVLPNGDFIPVVELEEPGYYLAYDHLPTEEMLDACKRHFTEVAGEPEDTFDFSEEDIVWAWAYAKADMFGDVRYYFTKEQPDDDDSFPVTYIHFW